MQRARRRLLAALDTGAVALAVAPATVSAALQVDPRTRVPVFVRVDTGFHWLDAAIGAAAALGLALLVLGLALTTRRAKGER
jgi:hypothetical protein